MAAHRSDLAVAVASQGRGIGRELIRLTPAMRSDGPPPARPRGDGRRQPSQALAAEYSAVAAAYDRHWAPVIGPMARQVLGELPLAKARRILDLGCGTGQLLPHLGGAGPLASLVGADRSAGMLRIAQEAARRPLAVMDAERLAFRAGSFDVALLAFMLFHVPEPAAALSQVRRVLRAGGTVGVVTWGEKHTAPGVAIWTEELDSHGAALDERDPSVMQQAAMDTPEKVGGLLEAAGFGGVRLWSKRFAHSWTVDALFAMQVACGMPARRLASLRVSARKACQARVRERLSQLPADELVHRPEVLYATAHRLT